MAGETLAEWLKQSRNRRGLKMSQKELESRTGIGQSYLNKIESGQAKKVAPEKVVAIAQALNVPVEEGLAAAARSAGYVAPEELRLKDCIFQPGSKFLVKERPADDGLALYVNDLIASIVKTYALSQQGEEQAA